MVSATTPASEAVLAASPTGSTFSVKLGFAAPAAGIITSVAVNVAHVGVRDAATDHLVLRPDARGAWTGTTSKALPPGRYWWWIDIDWTVSSAPDGNVTRKSGTVRRWFSVVRAPGRDCGDMTLAIDEDGAATADSIRAQGMTLPRGTQHRALLPAPGPEGARRQGSRLQLRAGQATAVDDDTPDALQGEDLGGAVRSGLQLQRAVVVSDATTMGRHGSADAVPKESASSKARNVARCPPVLPAPAARLSGRRRTQ